jgi:hypothetical protein
MTSRDEIPASTRYQTASYESTMRIVERDRILMQYLLGAGALTGIALGSTNFRELALVIPYMAVVVALLLTHHDYVISLLASYLGELAIKSDLHNQDWQLCRRGSRRATITGFFLRLGALVIAIGAPSYAAILLTEEPVKHNALLYAIWTSTWYVTGAALILIVGVRLYRIVQHALAWQRAKREAVPKEQPAQEGPIPTYEL